MKGYKLVKKPWKYLQVTHAFPCSQHQIHVLPYENAGTQRLPNLVLGRKTDTLQYYLVNSPFFLQYLIHLAASSGPTQGSVGSDKLGDDWRAFVRSNKGTPSASLFSNPIGGHPWKKSSKCNAGFFSGSPPSFTNLDNHSSQGTRGTLRREENILNAALHGTGLGCSRCRY